MASKRREYYTGAAGRNNLLYEGVCAEARVVSVLRGGIFVELFGVETYIPLRELNYQRMLDATGAYQPGQRVVVKLLEIHRADRDHIRVAASVKLASANPYEKALRRYSVGNRYVGTVSMVDTTGVFVALDGGVDCLCSYPPRGRPPGRPGDCPHSGHQSRNKPYLGRDHPCLYAPLRRTFVQLFCKILVESISGDRLCAIEQSFCICLAFFAGNVVV